MKALHPILHILPAAALALFAMPALAQEGGGHALDANPGVGTGGQNTADPGNPYGIEGNDIVTGNVADGKAFRGDVGYRSSRDFGADLPSNDLYRFRADSLGSAVGTQVRSGAMSGYNVTVLRSFGDTTGGAGRGSYVSFDGSSNIYQSSAVPTGGNYLTHPAANLMSTRSILGSYRDGNQVRQLEASPFLGIRQVRYETPAWPVPGQTTSAATPMVDESVLDLSRFGSTLQVNRQTTLDNKAMVAPQGYDFKSWRQPGNALGQTLITGQAPAAPIDRSTGSGNPLKQLNQLVDDPDYDPQAEANQDSAYSQIVAQIRAARTGVAEYYDFDKDQDAYKMPTLNDDTTAEEVAKARADRLARLQSLGLIPKDYSQPNQPKPQDHRTPAEIEASMSETDRVMAEAQKILMDLDVDLAPVQTMAGKRDSQVNALYGEAEKLMAAGRYFDAEAKYRQILVLSDDQPLAEVGMANAMIGAGMIRSAAAQLHDTFARHPELITVRYDPKLLPAVERLGDIDKLLRKSMQDSGESAARSAIVMAYLGYQFRNPNMMEYGLLIGQTRQPKDPLWEVLRKVWLDNGQHKKQGIELPKVE